MTDKDTCSFAEYSPRKGFKCSEYHFSYEVVGISEIDKNALLAYGAVHGHCPNFGDISKIDWEQVPDFDLFTYSFPCFRGDTLVYTINGYR